MLRCCATKDLLSLNFVRGNVSRGRSSGTFSTYGKSVGITFRATNRQNGPSAEQHQYQPFQSSLPDAVKPCQSPAETTVVSTVKNYHQSQKVSNLKVTTT